MTLKGIAFSVAKGIGKIVLLLLLLFVTLGAYTWYKERPIRKFCDNISATATPGSILAVPMHKQKVFLLTTTWLKEAKY